MKAGLVMCGPDVAYGPLALLSGSFEEKAAKAQLLRLVLADKDLAVTEFGRKTYELEEIFLNIVQGDDNG